MDSNTRSIEWFYDQLPVPQEERHCLTSKHNVKNFQHLVNMQESLERHGLQGISDATQYLLASSLKYLKGKSLDNFDKNDFAVSLKSKRSDNLPEVLAGKMAKRVFDEARSTSTEAKKSRTHAEIMDDEDEILKELSLQEIEKDALNDDLTLALQGFGISNSYSQGDLDNERGSKPEHHLQSFELNGITFHAGKCYTYRKQDGTESSVGIKYINPLNATAKCVLVIPKQQTFLGKISAHRFDKETESLGSFVQVQVDICPLPLSDFTSEFIEQPSIPKLIYLPQSKGSWQTFGYFIDGDQVNNRVGLRSTKLRMVELYSGAGGAHNGYDIEGIETAGVVELWGKAMETFRLNNRDVPIDRTFNMTVEKFVHKYKTDEAFREHIGPIDILHGSPPCQGFSGANVFGGQNDEKNRKESLTCLEAVLAIQPKVFVFENVVGIWCRKHKEYIFEILLQLMMNDYQVLVSVVRACDYGSSQKRPRFIIVAVKSHIPLPASLLLNKPYGESPSQLPYVSVKAVLDPLLAPEAANLPNMGDTKTTTMKEGEGKVEKLKADELAPAVRGGGLIPHYDEERCLNVRESAMLQGFPCNFVFPGTNVSDMYKMIGNAVPFELAVALARMAKEILRFNYKTIETGGGAATGQDMAETPNSENLEEVVDLTVSSDED